MTHVYGILTDPTGRPLQRHRVAVSLVAPGNPFDAAGAAVTQIATVDTDTDGRWEIDLVPTSSYEFAGAYYQVDWRIRVSQADAVFAFTVPASGGPYNFRSQLITPPSPGVPIPPITAHHLGDHIDVSTVGVVNGDVLTFVLADGKWEPRVASGGGTVTSVSAANGTIVVAGTPQAPTIAVGSGIPESAITGLVVDLAAKYVKPVGGIPALDLAAAVQALLTAAGTAVQPGTLATVAFSGAYADLTGKPVLATVATTGAYADLTGKPTIPSTPGDVGAQPSDADLTAIAALAPADDALIQRKAGAWTSRTPVQLKTDLTLTKADIGLGSVDNTSDASKPVSTAQAAAIAASAATLQPLDADLTTIAALTSADDSVMQRKAGAWTGRSPAQLKTDLVLTKSDVGLSAVDNTSDVNKPVSTAQAAAIALKQDLPPAGDNLTTWLTTFDTNITSGQTYSDPTAPNVTDFLNGLAAIARGDTTSSLLTALGFTIQIGFEAVTKRKYALVYNEFGTARCWGAYMVDLSTEIIRGMVQAPHPVFDQNSEFMALQSWRDHPGTLLMISGSHRTDTTGTNPRDVAHNVNSLYHQVALKYLAYGLPQLAHHGYADATDPAHDIVVSSGSANSWANIRRVADTLTAAGFLVDTNWVTPGGPLVAVTDVQGLAAQTAGTSFCHIEVNNTVRTSPTLLAKYEAAVDSANYFGTTEMGWAPLADAVTGQFPSSVGSANSAGTSPYLSRSDHQHRLTTNTPANGDFVMRLGGAWTSTLGNAALTDAATIATDAAAGEVFTVTLAGNRTLGTPTNPRDTMRRTWRFVQDATGSRTITLSSAFVLGSNVPNTTLTGTAGKVGYLSAEYFSTTSKWHVLAFEPGA